MAKLAVTLTFAVTLVSVRGLAVETPSLQFDEVVAGVGHRRHRGAAGAVVHRLRASCR